MKNTFILILLGLTLSNCLTHQKIQNKKESLAKLDKIFQSLEFKFEVWESSAYAMHSYFYFENAKIKFAYEPDSIFVTNEFGKEEFENRIDLSTLNQIKNLLINPISKHQIKKEIKNQVYYGSPQYAFKPCHLIFSNDTISLVCKSNYYTERIIEKLIKNNNP